MNLFVGGLTMTLNNQKVISTMTSWPAQGTNQTGFGKTKITNVNTYALR